jgi:hypothetical protein
MNETEIMEEYSARYKYAKYCQYLAIPMLLISITFLWISGGAFGTAGEKLFLITGGILLISSISLALFSVDKYRCPNCFHSLGVVRKIKFCPYCGVKLQSMEESDWMYSSHEPGERRGIFDWIGNIRFSGRGISRTAIPSVLQQGGIRPRASDFPEETYPKNIRLFTTSDEMELTKRYIRLISKDDSVPLEGTPAVVPEKALEMDRGERIRNTGDSIPRKGKR